MQSQVWIRSITELIPKIHYTNRYNLAIILLVVRSRFTKYTSWTMMLLNEALIQRYSYDSLIDKNHFY